MMVTLKRIGQTVAMGARTRSNESLDLKMMMSLPTFKRRLAALVAGLLVSVSARGDTIYSTLGPDPRLSTF